MGRKFRKTISLFLSFCLLFTQTGLAQVAGELDLSNHFARLGSAFLQPDTFRPLHLRYLSYDRLANSFNLLLDKGDSLKAVPKGTLPQGTPSQDKLKQETRELLNYFFIGISLPNSSFWVNLRPDSPDNIIDPELAQTDIGKVFLEADLNLKKDTAQATSPSTPEGKEYWDKLYKKAGELYGSDNITIPTLTRPWIVPDEIIIRESSDNAYIYKATLKVCLEQDYLKTTSNAITSTTDYTLKDERSKALNAYSTQLIKELIIPKLTKEVNSSKRYASLRQVYYSLILAQWFKTKFYGQSGTYSYLIDRHNLQGLTSQTPWDKDTYFQAYKQSFAQGEYNIKEPVYTPSGQTIRSYMSGGIAFGTEIGGAISAGSVITQRSSVASRDIPYLKYSQANGGTLDSPFEVKIEEDNAPTVGQIAKASSSIGLPEEKIELRIYQNSDEAKAVLRIFGSSNAVFEVVKNLYNINIVSSDVVKVIVENLPAKARQKAILKVSVLLRQEVNKIRELSFVIYAPNYGRTSLDEERNLPLLSAISDQVIKFAGLYKTNVQGWSGEKTITLVAAEFVDGDNLYDIWQKGNLDLQASILLQRKAVAAFFDIWAKSHGRMFIADVSLGQVVRRLSDGAVKIVDTGFLRKVEAPNKLSPAKIMGYFEGVFVPPIPGMEQSRWVWSDMKDKTEFFQGIVDALGLVEGIDFLREAKKGLNSLIAEHKAITAMSEAIDDYLESGIKKHNLFVAGEFWGNPLKAKEEKQLLATPERFNPPHLKALYDNKDSVFKDRDSLNAEISFNPGIFNDIAASLEPLKNKFNEPPDGSEIKGSSPVSETQTTAGSPILDEEITRSNNGKIFSDDFRNVLFKESMGGNAGRNRAAVNGLADKSGRIIIFGNLQNFPQEIQKKYHESEYYQFTILVTFGRGFGRGITEYALFIEDQPLLGEPMPETARAALQESVDTANQKISSSVSPKDSSASAAGSPAAKEPIFNSPSTQIPNREDIEKKSAERYAKWKSELRGRIEKAKTILIWAPHSYGGITLGDVATTMPILIKSILASGAKIEEIRVRCDSYPELITAIGDKRITLAGKQETIEGANLTYAPDLVMDFTSSISERTGFDNTIYFPWGEIGLSLGRYAGMRFVLESAGLKVPAPDEPILERGRKDRKNGATVFVNPHGDTIDINNIEAWSKLISDLITFGYKVILNEGKENKEQDIRRTKSILSAVGELGQTPETFHGAIDDLLKALSVVDAVVTVDTGVFHVARLFALPTVVFTGDASNGWVPNGTGWSSRDRIGDDKLLKTIKLSEFNDPSVVLDFIQDKSGVSSPVAVKDIGGIDMRSLPKYTKVEKIATGRSSAKQGQPLAGTAPVSDKEWLEIERMANSGIAPSCERIREYLLSLRDPNSQIDKVLACIADILRREEEQACATESSLKEILVLLESGKPVNELRLALIKIQVFAKEPQLIAQ